MQPRLLIPSTEFGNVVSTYAFPALSRDEHGVVAHHQAGKYAAYVCFQLMNGFYQPVLSGNDVRDCALEDVFRAHPTLVELELDLRQGLHPRTCIASLYPASIAFTPVYDVVYYSDWLFKYIWRYITRLILLNQPFDQVGLNDHVLSVVPNTDGLYTAVPTTRRAGFTALKNEIMLFKLRNKQHLEPWRANFAKYTSDTVQFKAQLMFEHVDVEDHGDKVFMHNVTPRVLLGDMQGLPLPRDHPAHILQAFVEAHYPKLKAAFPVYTRLETVFKLLTLNALNQNTQAGLKLKDVLTAVATHVESPYLNGGVKMQPAPKVQTKSWVHEKFGDWTCRQAFDVGGLACTFAPAGHIEDCLEQNEKNLFDCLTLEEKDKKGKTMQQEH